MTRRRRRQREEGGGSRESEGNGDGKDDEKEGGAVRVWIMREWGGAEPEEEEDERIWKGRTRTRENGSNMGGWKYNNNFKNNYAPASPDLAAGAVSYDLEPAIPFGFRIK